MKEREQYLIANFALKGKEATALTTEISAKIGKKLTEKGIEFDTFTIVPVETYPEDPRTLEMATKSEKELHARPELVGKYSGMKEVKNIVLIVPNWWNSLPMGVFTFFDQYDFSGKKIVPVVVHSGDGEGKITEEIRDFVKNVWVLPAVEIKVSEVETCDDKIEKVISELFEVSKSKF